MAEFTTGEAVALELPIARIPTRAAAFLIDVVVQVTCAFGLFLALAVLVVDSGVDSAWLDAATIVIIVAVLVGYPVACETLMRGRTPGKAALGLRVLRADGGPIDFRHAVTRGLAGAIVDFWMFGGFGVIALLTSLCSPSARRVGDVLAGTVVVHAEAPLPAPAMARTPPWLSDWAARLDLSGIPEDLGLAVRQYLTRLPTLTPQAQDSLGHQLTEAVCARLPVARPPGYPPVQILGAILAERQRRALTPGGPGLLRTF